MGVEAANSVELSWAVDDWLSRALNRTCLRAARKATSDDMSIPLPEVPGFYSIKVPTDNHDLVRDLYARKFNLYELHVALRFQADPVDFSRANSDGAQVSVAERQQIPSLQAIAVECFGNSRFHRDAHIEREFADKVWEQWVNDAVNDANRIVLVAHSGQQIFGFISLRPLSASLVSIDLFAVAAQFRRGRIGELLTSSVTAIARSPVEIVCETEAWNAPALNFYGKLGFTSGSLYSIFHFHKSSK